MSNTFFHIKTTSHRISSAIDTYYLTLPIYYPHDPSKRTRTSNLINKCFNKTHFETVFMHFWCATTILPPHHYQAISRSTSDVGWSSWFSLSIRRPTRCNGSSSASLPTWCNGTYIAAAAIDLFKLPPHKNRIKEYKCIIYESQNVVKKWVKLVLITELRTNLWIAI